MNRMIPAGAALLALALAGPSETLGPELGFESVWEPAATAVAAARQACSGSTPPGSGACFANAMAQAGASPEAVAFARANDGAYVRAFQESGVADIAAIARPFRANDIDGLLLVNGSPQQVDVDDMGRLPEAEMKRDADYAAQLRTHPKAMLLPGDRSSPDSVELEPLEKGRERYLVDYRVVDGCRACASLGRARFGFEFDADGRFEGVHFTGFSLPESAEEDYAAPDPLDMSAAPKLIRVLYEATREYKEARVLEKIAAAREMATGAGNVKAVGPQGRTALHWVVFGAAAETKPRLLAAYEELATELIDAGADVNREDQYQNTPLDYLEYAPNHEMQSLLLERGAVSGYFTGDLQERFVDLFQRVENAAASGHIETVRQQLAADLVPGQTIPVRLVTTVSSRRSWTGDPIAAVVTAPVVSGSRTLLAPGTRVEGTVFYSQTAPNKYDTPRLALDFANIVHPGGARSPVFVRVSAVDNARETIRNNEIFGITQPHVPNKASWGLRLVSLGHPGIAWAIEGIRNVYGLSIRREIDYPAGTDLTLQVTGPSKLREMPKFAGWKKLAASQELERLVAEQPMRTATSKGELSDVTNILFAGSREQLERAFLQAGWLSAARLNVVASLKAFQATVRKSGYDQAPVSLLRLEGKPPDLVFQKSLNTFAKRHHLRIWKQEQKYRGRDVWVCAATHDTGIGVEVSKKWFHRIDPRIDRERNKVQRDLLFTRGATAYALVDRPRAPRNTKNATGDSLLTDGRMLVLWLAEDANTKIAAAPAPR